MLPEGAPLEITLTVTMTGYRSPLLVGGNGEARAGMRAADELPQGPLDETTYPFDEATDARVSSPRRNGYFQVSSDSPLTTIANGKPVALYVVLFTHGIGRGHVPPERIIARAGFAITAVSGHELTITSAAHETP